MAEGTGNACARYRQSGLLALHPGTCANIFSCKDRNGMADPYRGPCFGDAGEAAGSSLDNGTLQRGRNFGGRVRHKRGREVRL